jgi:hypothetical protein
MIFLRSAVFDVYPFHAVASVENDGWQENVKEDLWVEGCLKNQF